MPYFLHKWENEREPGKLLHPNTFEVQFNILQTLVHRAIEVGIMEPSKNPFLVFKYKGVKTTKEKLDDDEMQRIINLELEEGSLICHCKNYFLFNYYCAGICAADLIQLRWRNVSASGRLHYQMGKNHKERDLLLVEPAIEILRYYRRELKKALMSNLSSFLLELGSGFAYIGQEYRLKVGQTEQFIDLLFYNTKIHAYCVVDVKTGTFGAGDVG